MGEGALAHVLGVPRAHPTRLPQQKNDHGVPACQRCVGRGLAAESRASATLAKLSEHTHTQERSTGTVGRRTVLFYKLTLINKY